VPEPIEVRKVPLHHVSDASELAKLIDGGVLEADRVIAVIGKTEGNGGVNDYTRILADRAFREVLVAKGTRGADAVAQVPIVWSGGTDGVISPHATIFATVPADRAAATSEPRLAEWRERLLGAHAGLVELLEPHGLLPALDDVVYCAHWITPVAEPRRYDTRFFLARLPAARSATADAREMTDALWLTPAEALRRFQEGALPMVFPTVKLLEALAPYASVSAALTAFRGRPVLPVLPRLVRTADGVGIVVDQA